jgi:hypothetical protein
MLLPLQTWLIEKEIDAKFAALLGSLDVRIFHASSTATCVLQSDFDLSRQGVRD